MRRWLFVLALSALVIPGCIPTLRSPMPATADHLDLQQRYFVLHPDDPFREAIEAGELREGMSPTQVYLAWGRPLERIKAERTQRWLYEFREPNPGEGQPAVVARLFFEDGVLVRWQRDRHTVNFRQSAADPDPLADLRDLPAPDAGKSHEP